MFNYEDYIKELMKIKKEEIAKWPDDIDKIDEYEKPFIEKRSTLNKKHKIILKHNLKDAWEQPIDEFYIIDSDKDNILIIKHGKKYSYSIPKEDLESIKKLLSNDTLFKKRDIVIPPVLDGTSHEIYLSNGHDDIEIECLNLWYWLEKEVNNNNNLIATAADVHYTKELIKLFKTIQEIITTNNITYNILTIDD